MIEGFKVVKLEKHEPYIIYHKSQNIQRIEVNILANARKLPSGNYRVRIYVNGKCKSFTADTKREAERLALEYEKKYKYSKQSEMSIEQAIDNYIELKSNVLSPTTLHRYDNIKRNQLSKDFLKIRMCDLTLSDVQAEINQLASRYAPKTVHNANGLVSAVVRYYVPDLQYKVTLPKKVKHFKKYPSASEIMEMFKGTDIELVVLLALWYGLRLSEVRGLRKEDFENGILTINRVKVTVGSKSHVKAIAKTTESNRQLNVPNVIQRKIDVLENGYITQYDNRHIYQRFKRIVKKNGYPDITFHDLRHINASIMLMLNVPDKYAMERGGWASNNTLKQVYQSTFSDERKRVDSVIDNYFSKVFATSADTDANKKLAKSHKFKLRKL